MKIKKHKNGVYYAHIWSESGDTAISLRTKDLTEAKLLAKTANYEELEHAAKARLLTAEAFARISSGGRITNEKALGLMLDWMRRVGTSPITRERYETYCRKFFNENSLMKRSPVSITADMCDAFVNTSDDVKYATRRARHAALQTYFQVLLAKGLVVGNPSAEVRVHRHTLTHEQKETEKKPPFTNAELKQLKAVEDPFWKAGAVLGDTYGLRISDVAQLEWAVFAKPGKVIVWTDKRDRRIELELTPEVERLMASLPKSDTRWVFPEWAEVSRDPKGRSKTSTYFKRLLTKLGIEGKSFHSFRAGFATRHHAEGTPIDDIREKMGHVHAETTKGYIHSETAH